MIRAAAAGAEALHRLGHCEIGDFVFIGGLSAVHQYTRIGPQAMVGGVCVNTGTIPSKTLREAVLYLTGMDMRELYGASYRVKEEITISDLLARLQHVIGRETEIIRAQLQRNHVELVAGTASFVDPHTLSVDLEDRLRRICGRELELSTAALPENEHPMRSVATFATYIAHKLDAAGVAA